MNKRAIYVRLINTAKWRALRNVTLAATPVCRDCRLMPASEVHHIVAVESGTTEADMARLAYDPNNLVALCRGCHAARHRAMGRCTKEENARRKRADAEAFLARFMERSHLADLPPGAFLKKGGGGR